MDETGAYYTKWSKSEIKTPIQYINAYIWNLERGEWWPYMRDSKRDSDVKNRLLDSGRRRGRDDLREQHWNTCIIICETDRQSRFNAWYKVLGASALGWPRGTGWGWGGRFRMGNTCTPVVDSRQCMAKPLQYCKVISLQLK